MALLGLTGLTACGSEKGAGSGPSGGTTADNLGLTRYAATDRKDAPKLEGTTLEDTRFALTELKGKVVVVNFWGSWCPPCRAESPALKTVHEATADKGVAFVGVQERDNRAAGRAYQKTYGLTYPSVMDEDGRLAALWPAGTGLPFTFVLDKQGRIAARFIAGVTTDDLQAEVLRVASEA